MDNLTKNLPEITNILPVITSIIISILFYRIKLSIKNEFDERLSLFEQKLKEEYEYKKQNFELQYKLKYDEKTKINNKLELLYQEFMVLDSCFILNYKDIHNKGKINKSFSDIKNILVSIEIGLDESIKQIMSNLFNHNDGVEYLENHIYDKYKYEGLKKSFTEQLKFRNNE